MTGRGKESYLEKLRLRIDISPVYDITGRIFTPVRMTVREEKRAASSPTTLIHPVMTARVSDISTSGGC